uniref:Uncharacterized protein n=1 Tax=Romanomermis culicivorax TaxID=13658 RepID=A0A915JTP6_ROMCU
MKLSPALIQDKNHFFGQSIGQDPDNWVNNNWTHITRIDKSINKTRNANQTLILGLDACYNEYLQQNSFTVFECKNYVRNVNFNQTAFEKPPDDNSSESVEIPPLKDENPYIEANNLYSTKSENVAHEELDQTTASKRKNESSKAFV